jgi:hypothetical protein
MKRLSLVLWSAWLVAAFAGSALAQPDVRQMSGMPLPVADMPAGSVTVRVLRGAISNPITGHQVEIQGDGAPVTATTNETGRAEFKGLPVGTTVKAVTTVNGQRLQSQEFAVPASGGVRVMLVALDAESEKRAAEDRKLAEGPAQPGTVVLGSESRFVFEMGDDGLSVFNIFQVFNSGKVPVQTPEPLVFDVPAGAGNASMIDGSSEQAVAAGQRVTVTGPFTPGTTLVQFAYTMPYSRSDLTIEQKLPVPLVQFSVAAQKVGEMHLLSPQMTEHRDATSDGQTYIVGEGPAVPAGQTITFNFTGLPRVSVWPRNVALALAVLILVGGAWVSVRGHGSTGDTVRRRKLEGQRDRFFGELATLEQQYRARAVDDERYTTRRRELVAALERVYAELDEEGLAVGRAS